MTVTIIIPTIGEPTLERVIQSAKNEIPGAEIIVVGYGPAKAIAEKYAAIFLDTKIKTPKPIGINQAVCLAKNDWIIILDADAIPKKGWGQNMLAGFKSGKSIFSGSVDISEGNFWMKVYNLSYFHEYLPDNPPQDKSYLPAISMGFTRAAYELGGSWDETQVTSEDYEWTLRLYKNGLIPRFEPGAVIIHLPATRRTFRSVWQAWERSGYFNWIIRKKYADLVKTPAILYHPFLVLLLSPLLAVVPTLRILKTSPINFFRYIYLIPFVYLTKIAWCIGVYKMSKIQGYE
jgi:cellulose synthase/poly-beta-1,6-N-acetylglucosamine synthase-like glycosyltransferase